MAPSATTYIKEASDGRADVAIQATGTAMKRRGILVIGASTDGVGVKGAATTGFPIVGQVVGPASANTGVPGIGTAGPGVQGQSTRGHGLVGTTSATDGVHAALIGSVQSGSNAIGLRGSVQAGAVGYAVIFDGDVLVNGALRVFGSPKNAAVKHPADNSYRLLYCMESPESWFEDFGHGRAGAGGRAGPEIAARTFAWRVVAKRKDIAGERLAKIAPPPPLKPVTPFTVPVTPFAALVPSEAKPPAKKP